MCQELTESIIERIRVEIQWCKDWVKDSEKIEAELIEHENDSEIEYERAVQAVLLIEIHFLTSLLTKLDKGLVQDELPY